MNSEVRHLNGAMIEQLRELLEDRFSELVDRFVTDGQDRVDQLKEAVNDFNFDVIYTQAHGLKGSSRNVGADPLGDLCAKLEAQGKAANSEGIEQLFAAIVQEFAAVCAELRQA